MMAVLLFGMGCLALVAGLMALVAGLVPRTMGSERDRHTAIQRRS
jgi:hypothetical protein